MVSELLHCACVFLFLRIWGSQTVVWRNPGQAGGVAPPGQGTGARSTWGEGRGSWPQGGLRLECSALCKLASKHAHWDTRSFLWWPAPPPLPSRTMVPYLSCRSGPSPGFPLPWLSTPQPLVYPTAPPACSALFPRAVSIAPTPACSPGLTSRA